MLAGAPGPGGHGGTNGAAGLRSWDDRRFVTLSDDDDGGGDYGGGSNRAYSCMSVKTTGVNRNEGARHNLAYEEEDHGQRTY